MNHTAGPAMPNTVIVVPNKEAEKTILIYTSSHNLEREGSENNIPFFSIKECHWQ